MNFLLVGDPGSGKTSWCLEYIHWLRGQGLGVGGVLSPEVRLNGERTGFDIVDLSTGKHVAFARLSSQGLSGGREQVGPYIIAHDAIMFARCAVEKAVEDNCNLIVVDEVGPLELRNKGLMPVVQTALASSSHVLLVVRSSLRETVEKRFMGYKFLTLHSSSPYPQVPKEAGFQCGSPFS